MAYNRSKSKTSRRVKRAKTNKRNNKRKQTFRKSRRINKGGKGPQKRSPEDDEEDCDEKRVRQEDAPQPNSLEEKALQYNANDNDDPDFNATKARAIAEKIEYNKEGKNFKDGKSRYIDTQKDNYWDIVDQTEELEIAKMQERFGDDMKAETKREEGEEGEKGDLDNEIIWFGGKKKRAIKRKATRRK
jgi:hypothetical protein